MPKVKMPIPDDWDGKTWDCFQVQFPSSEQYQAYFVGLMSTLMRGRFWDENTGSVVAVQAIGKEIYYRNVPMTTCDDQVVTPDTEMLIEISGAGCAEEDGCNMGCITDITIEDGILYKWFGPCCKIAVGNLREIRDEVDEPFVEEDPQPDFYACGKATAVIDVLWDVLDAAWDAQGAPPWQWISNTQGGAHGFDLSNNHIITMVVEAITLDSSYSKSEVLNVLDKQRLYHGLAEMLDDTSAGVSEDQYTALVAMPSQTASNSAFSYFFKLGIVALGQKNISSIAALGAKDDTGDCASPDYGTGLFQFTAYVEELTSLPNAQDGEMTTELSEGNQVLSIDWSGTTSVGSTDNTSIFGVACIGPISEVTLRLQGDQMPTIEWDATCPPQDLPNVCCGRFDVAADDEDKSYGADYVDVTFSWVTPTYLTRWGYYDSDSARWCGQTAPNPFQADWTVTVLNAE